MPHFHCFLFIAFIYSWSEDGQRPPLQCSIRICSVIRGRPKAAPTMFYPNLFGYPRTVKGRPYIVLFVFVRLSEDGQWPSLRCSIRICSVIGGRPMAVPTMFYPHLFGYWRTANGRPYNVLSVFVRLFEDGQWPSLQYCFLLSDF